MANDTYKIVIDIQCGCVLWQICRQAVELKMGAVHSVDRSNDLGEEMY